MTKPVANALIVASAGTGKTYQLVERLVRLLDAGVKPQELVALTFSRAAAGEIFSRLVARLAGAPEKSPPVPPRPDLLRKVVEAQHLTMIGTIDAFLMRMVRTFPLELGLQGDVSIMDDYQGAAARAATADGLLSGDAELGAALVDALRASRAGEGDPKTWNDTLLKFVDGYTALLLAHPDAAAWGGLDHIWPDGAPFRASGQTHAEMARALGTLDPAFEAIGRENFWTQFKDFVRGFNLAFGGPAGVANVLAAYDGATGTLGAFKYNRRAPVLSGADRALIARTLESLFAEVLAVRAKETAALYRILSAFAADYEAAFRSRGRITFDDLSRLVGRLDAGVRLALEYRFDAHFTHWALDEFQDTNRAQWRALGNLVSEIIQSAGGDRSILIVGDPKQAIYGWRGGEVDIFAGEIGHAHGTPRPGDHYARQDLVESRRYVPEIADTVNAVFGRRAIHAALDAGHRAVADRWADLWEDHTSYDRIPGRGYVRVVKVMKPERGSGLTQADIYLDLLAAEFARVKPAAHGLSAAVLVRDNEHGAVLAAGLRARGLKAVWEGETPIADTPAIAYLTALVAAAEHPGDASAAALLASSPLAGRMDVRPDAFLRDVTRLGLARALRGVLDRLPPEAQADALVAARLGALLRAAARFEAEATDATRLDEFPAFLAAETERTSAGADAIRVQSIHHSKGLGFDLVAVPEFEGARTFGKSRLAALAGPDWVLKDPGAAVDAAAAALGGAVAAADDRALYEALCLRYVAFTRAKRELLVLVPETDADRVLSFSRMVCGALAFDAQGVFEKGAADWFAAISTGSRGPAREPRPTQRGDTKPSKQASPILRSTPSAFHGEGRSAAELFEPQGSTGRARGVEEHAKYAKVEWLDAAVAKTEFEKALVRPAGLVDLWREKRYELVADGTWETGQFDRVVFQRVADGRMTATVYDFKTNLRRPGEEESAFRARLAATYSGQMAAYRRAVAKLAELPSAAVSTVLLATAIQGAIPV